MDNPFNEISEICERLDVIGKGLDEVLEKQKDIVIAVEKIIDKTKDSSCILDKTVKRHEGNIQKVKKLRFESSDLKNSLDI